MMIRYLAAGEAHGWALVAVLEGMPAGLLLSVADTVGGKLSYLCSCHIIPLNLTL